MHINIQESPDENIKRSTSRTGIRTEFARLSWPLCVRRWGLLWGSEGLNCKECSNLPAGFNLYLYLHSKCQQISGTLPKILEVTFGFCVFHIASRSLGRSGYRGKALIKAKSQRSLTVTGGTWTLISWLQFSFCSTSLPLSFSKSLFPHLLNERLE